MIRGEISNASRFFFLPSAAAPIVAAAPAEYKNQHDDQDNKFNAHVLLLPWAKTGRIRP
jgi:hypothetical protein